MPEGGQHCRLLSACSEPSGTPSPTSGHPSHSTPAGQRCTALQAGRQAVEMCKRAWCARAATPPTKPGSWFLFAGSNPGPRPPCCLPLPSSSPLYALTEARLLPPRSTMKEPSRSSKARLSAAMWPSSAAQAAACSDSPCLDGCRQRWMGGEAGMSSPAGTSTPWHAPGLV